MQIRGKSMNGQHKRLHGLDHLRAAAHMAIFNLYPKHFNRFVQEYLFACLVFMRGDAFLFAAPGPALFYFFREKTSCDHLFICRNCRCRGHHPVFCLARFCRIRTRPDKDNVGTGSYLLSYILQIGWFVGRSCHCFPV